MGICHCLAVIVVILVVAAAFTVLTRELTTDSWRLVWPIPTVVESVTDNRCWDTVSIETWKLVYRAGNWRVHTSVTINQTHPRWTGANNLATCYCTHMGAAAVTQTQIYCTCGINRTQLALEFPKVLFSAEERNKRKTYLSHELGAGSQYAGGNGHEVWRVVQFFVLPSRDLTLPLILPY